jgi:predicted MPP superfamily phosphohydrolase
VEPSWIEVTEVDVRLPGLPDPLSPLTIAQLSDFHVGPYVSAEDVRHSVGMANALGADLAVLTGDFVYRSARYSTACAQELGVLRARHGVFAVLGNHDIWTDADQVATNLSNAGIRVLRNEGLPLALGGTDLWLLGIEDTGYAGGSFSDFRAIGQKAAGELALILETIPADAPRLLLVHNPDFTEMLPEGRIDLVLCGHTHGGQVRVPLLGPPVVPSCFGQKYASGLVAGPRTIVYVNRGIGLIPPPIRFNCRPEITMFRLTTG